MPDWVYRADSDPDLAQTQPVQFQRFIKGQLDFQYSWLFAMQPPPDLASLGNNLFLSDPAFVQQQEGFVAFDQEMEDYEEDDDYDEGEIQEEDEVEDVESTNSGKAQASPPNNSPTPVPNNAKAPLSQPLLRSQTGSSGHPISSPMSNDKEAAQMKLEAMRVKLLASRKAGAMPMTNQNKTSAPSTASPSAGISLPPPETQSSTMAPKNTNGPSAEEVDNLVEEYMTAAEAEKNRLAAGATMNGGKSSQQLPQSQGRSSALVNPQEQYSKIQGLSARLSQRKVQESTAIEQTRPPKPIAPAQTQNNKFPQTPAGKETRPTEPSTKNTEIKSKPPSQPTSRRQSGGNIVVNFPNDRPSVARPPSRQPSPVRPGRLQIERRPEPKPFVMGLHPEIEEWLDLTGYHDPEYRQATLNLMRKRKRLDELHSSLEKEELEFQEAFQAQSQAAHMVVGRRSSSLMPPPPVPNRLQNGNVSNTNISFDPTPAATPTNSAFKRQRSPDANDLVDFPPQKVQRPTYPDDDREYKIRNAATEQNYSRPATPKYDQWRFDRPQGGVLESRIRGGAEGRRLPDHEPRYYEGDEGNRAQRGSYYDDFIDQDQDRGRVREYEYPQRGNAHNQRARGNYRGRGNNHNKDNERGARRG